MEVKHPLAVSFIAIPDHPLRVLIIGVRTKPIIVSNRRTCLLQQGPIQQQVVIDSVDPSIKVREKLPAARILLIADFANVVRMLAS